ncbi:hypothetical protein SAMN03084138_01961 [Enterovibrio norvegicus DSM 15893]|uniref:Uncharacterized protein n=2 Tax=Enterovibrio norvegicus TaxID=188144 RepID=A0A1I5PHQ0_9GAMM|nr:hypothetical protein SAMN03084138_01961 [Enterovibrio norvegicus DSM 15893]
MASGIDSRVTSPVVGTFFTSWALCNWDKLILLIWGEGTVNERIDAFSASLSPLDMSFFVGPAFLSLIYLFALPWVNHWIYRAQSPCEGERYSSAVDLDIGKEENRGRLVKATKKADMQDQIAEAEIEAEQKNLEADTRRRIAEAEKAESEKLEAEKRAEKARSEADERKAIAQKAADEAESKKIRAEKEKQEFELSAAIHNDKLKVMRFPAAFSLIEILSESIAADDVYLKPASLGAVIAATFGHGSFEELLNDKNFNHESLMKTRYLAYDDKLLPAFAQILDDNEVENWSEDWLFEHVQHLLSEKFKITISSVEGVIEEIVEAINNFDELLDLADDEVFISESANTNAIDYEADSAELTDQSFNSNKGLTLSFSTSLSGTTEEDRTFCGDTIDVSFDVDLPITVGAYGLGEHEKTVMSASLKDYSDPEDWDDVANS